MFSLKIVGIHSPTERSLPQMALTRLTLHLRLKRNGALLVLLIIRCAQLSVSFLLLVHWHLSERLGITSDGGFPLMERLRIYGHS